jgi:hypothetical protein
MFTRMRDRKEKAKQEASTMPPPEPAIVEADHQP